VNIVKVVINNCYGGFSLSSSGIDRYLELANLEMTANFYDRDIPRNDAALIRVVEELGDAANGACADLKIVEVPNEVDWYVEEYDGNDWVAERHRTWS
jgi:hypothetical protein